METGTSTDEAQAGTFGERLWRLIFRAALPVLIGLPLAAAIEAGDLEAARRMILRETVLVLGYAPGLILLWYASWGIAVRLLDLNGWSAADPIDAVRRAALTAVALGVGALIVWILAWLLSVIHPVTDEDRRLYEGRGSPRGEHLHHDEEDHDVQERPDSSELSCVIAG